MKMNLSLAALSVVFSVAFLASGSSLAQEVKVTLSGSQEVPPVTTSATGSGTVTVAPDMSLKVNITTSGINATAAHIHLAPAGQNGPVAVPFVKNGNSWSVAPTAKLTEAQYAAFKAGNLYVNVHSAAHPGGEIRAQIKP